MKRKTLWTLPNGRTVKQAASLLGVTANQLAKTAGISPTTACRLMLGHAPRPRPGVVDRIAKALQAENQSDVNSR